LRQGFVRRSILARPYLVRYLPRLLLILLMLLSFSYFGLYASQRHLAFETGAFDTGVYIQPLWNFIQGRDFAVSIIEDNGPIRWATHVEPILFLIAPLYALWPDPRTLFWLQIGALTLAALPLYALAVRRLQHEWAALVIVLAYFLMPATESVMLFDFHAVTLAPLFLLSAIYFLDRALALQGKSFWLWPEVESKGARGQGSKGVSLPHPSISLSFYQKLKRFFLTETTAKSYALSGLFFLLALSTKEDISLHVFMVGLYLLGLRRRWWEGSLLVIVGLAWFYLMFQVIIPAFRTGGGHSIYAAWFETLGQTPLEIAMSPITAPDKVLALIFRPGSLPALGMITVPQALLPWAGLPLLVLAAPSLAFTLLSQNPTLRQLETWHYAAPMLAFIMLAAIDGLARLSYLISYTLRNLQRAVPFTFYDSRFTVHILRFIPLRSPLTYLLLLLLVTSLIYHNLRGYTPLAQLFEWPEVTAHHQLGRQIAGTIPPEASVLAQAQLIPYVAHRYRLGIWSGPLFTDYDYIWLDLSHPKLPNRFDAHGDLVIGLIYEHAFGPVAATDGYLLLKNGAERVPLNDELFSFTRFDQPPAAAQPFNAVFGPEIRLIAVETEIPRLATSETEPQVVLYFEALQPPAQDYHLFVYLLDAEGQVVGATDYPQPSIFWWPTSRWQAGDRRQVRVNTMPWWTGDKTVFGYAIGFSRINDPWDVTARLPVTLLDPAGSQPNSNQTLLPIAAFRRFAGLPYPESLTILPFTPNQHQAAR
jgi:uncharacterized membrane protein